MNDHSGPPATTQSPDQTTDVSRLLAQKLARKYTVELVSHDLGRLANDESEERWSTSPPAVFCKPHDGCGETIQRDVGSVLLAMVRDQRLVVAGVRDSHTYLIRDGAMIRLDASPSDAKPTTPLCDDDVHASTLHIWRFLLEVLGLTGSTSSEDFCTAEVVDGDRILIVGDRVTDQMAEWKFEQVLNESMHRQEAADELVNVALQAGVGKDTTCIVIDIRDERSELPFDRIEHERWNQLVCAIQRSDAGSVASRRSKPK